jgi:hypothetical protein
MAADKFQWSCRYEWYDYCEILLRVLLDSEVKVVVQYCDGKVQPAKIVVCVILNVFRVMTIFLYRGGK